MRFDLKYFLALIIIVFALYKITLLSSKSDEKFDYRTRKIELNNNLKFNILLEIPQIISKTIALKIANKAKSELNVKSETGVIFFLLPEITNNNGAWARVQFNPEAEFMQIGSSLEDEKIKNEAAKN